MLQDRIPFTTDGSSTTSMTTFVVVVVVVNNIEVYLIPSQAYQVSKHRSSTTNTDLLQSARCQDQV